MTDLPDLPRPALLSRWSTAAAATLSPFGVWAHDGHGMPALHWHATDVWGFVAVGALLAFAVWIGRR